MAREMMRKLTAVYERNPDEQKLELQKKFHWWKLEVADHVH